MKRTLKNRIYRVISLILCMNLLVEIIVPSVAFALTSGPSQPEIQSFAPIESTEMVDLFTGDFSYNIPLLELPGPNGGYPFNLHYNSGATMDQEASWVGLGWNLNPGSLNREMRGLPDEFDGSQVVKTKKYIKPDITFGVKPAVEVEFFGWNPKKMGLGTTSLGLNIFYSNYRGAGLDVNFDTEVNSNIVPLEVNIGIGSQDGFDFTADLNYSFFNKSTSKRGWGIGMEFGYNSLEGMSALEFKGHFINRVKQKHLDKHANLAKKIKAGNPKLFNAGNHTAMLSHAYTAYMPSVSEPMQGRKLSFSVKLGPEFKGAFPHGSLTGFFSTTYLKDNGKTVDNKAYGYMHLDDIDKESENSMSDFNRMNEGPVRKNSPYLPVPISTHDIFIASGQGVSTIYRPFRNEVGAFSSPKTSSTTVGGSGGLEFGASLDVKVGFDVNINYSRAWSGAWPDNDNETGYDFSKRPTQEKEYEPYYFKSHGEFTASDPNLLESIGGDQAVRVDIDKQGGNVKALNSLSGAGTSLTTQNNPNGTSRTPRSTYIQAVNNSGSLTRGMYVINPDGTRYLYDTVMLNKKQVECVYAAGSQNENVCTPNINIAKDGQGNIIHKHDYTDNLYSRTELPAYAYSFPLTAILGSDYIDADGIPGPSDGDLGYWVKFHYTKKKETYKWRMPFYGANYNKGLQTTFEDDRGSYTYGEREVWHLDSAYTKSHVTVFNTSLRKDACGALSELQNYTGQRNDIMEEGSYKLDNIKLYAKGSSGKKLQKTVYFSYSYELCKGVYNNKTGDDSYGSGDPRYNQGNIINNDGGKLTLKSVWFTYENNQRGALSPYEFDYHATANGGKENPDYSPYMYDRWGNYKPYDEEGHQPTCKNLENPYTPQFSIGQGRSVITPVEFKNDMNIASAVWNLKEIKLPSGGTIKVSYEADDYAYVQNKTAMQMFRIASLEGGNTAASTIKPLASRASKNDRRVFFKLEKPIPSTNTVEALKEFGKYFDATNKVYFKVFMKIRKPGDNLSDYVAGYVKLTDKGLDENSKNTDDEYTRGFIEMENPEEIGRSLNFHPFSYAAWNYIRTRNPKLNGFGPYKLDPNGSKSALVSQLKSLGSGALQVIEMAMGYYTYALKQKWGTEIDLTKSYIRLNSPDKVKIGGGSRVKQLVLSDEWNAATIPGDGDAEKTSEYGQVYDYTIEEDGNTISSGVAQYEPMLGGDEIALRRNKEYVQSVPLKSDLGMYAELPVNESYFPGASVGYRKVTVKSLATHYEGVDDDVNTAGNQNAYNIPEGIMTTGASVHEFYTAKDFPVISDETTIDRKPHRMYIPIPPVGFMSTKNMAATQGYCTILNDMHGKPKQISQYPQDKQGNILWENPISWSKYTYQADPIVATSDFQEKPYFKLRNDVEVLISDRNGEIQKDIMKLGEEVEFYSDMQFQKSVACQLGGGVNVDVLNFILVVVPVGCFIPNASYTSTEVKTVVTNKIIHRSGILKKIESFNMGSKVVAENKMYDGQTGEVVLSTVTNSYEDPIYTYAVSAYHEYPSAGPAYMNTDISFSATINNGIVNTSASQWWSNLLVPGDQFRISRLNTSTEVVFKERIGNLHYFSFRNPGDASSFTGNTYNFNLIRSGKRNLLNAKIGSIQTLGSKSDPNIGNPITGRKNQSN
jgi:hypothetical protein